MGTRRAILARRGITLRFFYPRLARRLVPPDISFRPISRIALHAFCLACLISAVSCAYLRPHLTPAELSERLQYSHDRALEELVDLAMAQGYGAVNGGGQARQVLELNNSDSGTLHRQFFEVQPKGEGLSEVFFLENRGSVEHSKVSRFPRHCRRAISDFLEELPEARRSEYEPLRVRQEKLSRQMIVYETNSGRRAVEFTRKVVSLERSNLYGLYLLPDGPFIFFGQKAEELFRRDFLEADERYNDLIKQFLEKFRLEIKL